MKMINYKPITDPYQRQQYLLEKLDLKNLNEYQMEEMKRICFDFSDAFYIPNDTMRPKPIYKHSFKLKPNVDAVHIRQYRVPYAQREELERQVENWEKMGIIQKSTSRFNSPLLLVKKAADASGKPQFRACVDYRQVNKACIPQSYVLPLPDELFDMLHDSSIYSVFDVHAAYHQVEVEPQCRFITAFSAMNHHYEFKNLPFGLQSSSIGWLYAKY